MPWGSYKLTKYAAKLTLYCVQLYGFIPVTKLPKWASEVKDALPSPLTPFPPIPHNNDLLVKGI